MSNETKPCPASFPECSSDPNDCLENDGFGCGKPYPVTVCKKCGGDMGESEARMKCTKCGHSFLITSNKPMNKEYEKIEIYIVTALEECDHESGVRIILYEGDILTDACDELSDCDNHRNPALYSRV